MKSNETEKILDDLYNEIEKLNKSIKRLQNIAKFSLDKLPAKWNEGFQAGLKAANKHWEEAKRYGDEQKKLREDENANFTEEIIQLELEIEKLRGNKNE